MKRITTRLRHLAAGRQRGFTLIELLVGTAISGVIVTLIVTILFQASTNTTYQRGNLGSLDESRRVVLALTWDLQPAKTTSLADGATSSLAGGNTFTINTTDPVTGGTHTTVYSLSGTNLMRTYDGTAGVVGRYVTAISFSRAGSVYSVTATSAADGTASAATSTWKVAQRTV